MGPWMFVFCLQACILFLFLKTPCNTQAHALKYMHQRLEMHKASCITSKKAILLGTAQKRT